MPLLAYKREHRARCTAVRRPASSYDEPRPCGRIHVSRAGRDQYAHSSGARETRVLNLAVHATDLADRFERHLRQDHSWTTCSDLVRRRSVIIWAGLQGLQFNAQFQDLRDHLGPSGDPHALLGVDID